jgi:hypothetical protein
VWAALPSISQLKDNEKGGSWRILVPGSQPTPEVRLEVSGRLRGEFENGRTYYPMHGSNVSVPADPRLRPDPHLLRWHNDTPSGREPSRENAAALDAG